MMDVELRMMNWKSISENSRNSRLNPRKNAEKLPLHECNIAVTRFSPDSGLCNRAKNGIHESG